MTDNIKMLSKNGNFVEVLGTFYKQMSKPYKNIIDKYLSI